MIIHLNTSKLLLHLKQFEKLCTHSFQNILTSFYKLHSRSCIFIYLKTFYNNPMTLPTATSWRTVSVSHEVSSARLPPSWKSRHLEKPQPCWQTQSWHWQCWCPVPWLPSPSAPLYVWWHGAGNRPKYSKVIFR